MATIPCRNLAEAFDELYVSDSKENATTPSTKLYSSVTQRGKEAMVLDTSSPSGVSEFDHAGRATKTTDVDESKDMIMIRKHPVDDTPKESNAPSNDQDFDRLPHFSFHPDLQREMSQGLVHRVSFYGVVRDINKEAMCMAQYDTSAFHQAQVEKAEEISYIVEAVTGESQITESEFSNTTCLAALVDEERWLLTAIQDRGADKSQSRYTNTCPATFPQAMGEQEYENTISSLANSRTQLWKPSRSWWEAKSGKNPWMDPKGHNKRWRYLWPLIHYHKFLAKCIKKLKRNGVDVRDSVSPVSVFLREEVCAVSDHLAGVSLFTSDEWMFCLETFEGWTDPALDSHLRTFISKQKLRSLLEPTDVDSPLLRSQIDDHFLKAMVCAREQMQNSAAATTTDKKEMKKNGVTPNRGMPPKYPPRAHKMTPPLPQYISAASPAVRAKQRRSKKSSQRGYSGKSQFDDSSGCAQSGTFNSSMTSEIYPQHYNMQHHGYPMHPGAVQPAPYYHAPRHAYPSPAVNGEGCYYLPSHAGYYQHDPSYLMPDPYNTEHASAAAPPPGWDAYAPMPSDPNMQGYGGMPPLDGTYGHPPIFTPSGMQHGNRALNESMSSDHTPYKNGPGGSAVPPSPYWGHLDPMALPGVMTPQGACTPQRPDSGSASVSSLPHQTNATGVPLMINHPTHYYQHNGGGATEGGACVPPSPATQFMMSPQAHAQMAYFQNYNDGVEGSSPSKIIETPQHPLPPLATIDTKESMDEADYQSDVVKEETIADVGGNVTPPPSVRKITGNSTRLSPVTVGTTAESDSLDVRQ